MVEEGRVECYLLLVEMHTTQGRVQLPPQSLLEQLSRGRSASPRGDGIACADYACYQEEVASPATTTCLPSQGMRNHHGLRHAAQPRPGTNLVITTSCWIRRWRQPLRGQQRCLQQCQHKVKETSDTPRNTCCTSNVTIAYFVFP